MAVHYYDIYIRKLMYIYIMNGILNDKFGEFSVLKENINNFFLGILTFAYPVDFKLNSFQFIH